MSADDVPSTPADQVPVISTTTSTTTTTRTTSTTDMSTSEQPFEGQADQVVILGPIDPSLPTVEPIGGYTSIPQIIAGNARTVEDDEREVEDERDEVGQGGDELDVPMGDERRKTRPESYMTALTRLNSKDREVEEEDGQDEEVVRAPGESVGETGDVPEVVVVDTTSTNPLEPTTSKNPIDPPITSTTTNTTTTTPSKPRDLTLDPRPTPLPRPSVVHNFPQDERLSTSKGQKEKEKTTLSLKTWWKNFSSSSSGSNSGPTSAGQAGKRARKGSMGEGYGEGEVFAKTLETSLKYASVQISTARADGGLFVWG